MNQRILQHQLKFFATKASNTSGPKKTKSKSPKSEEKGQLMPKPSSISGSSPNLELLNKETKAKKKT
jgi:hypothetical protein